MVGAVALTLMGLCGGLLSSMAGATGGDKQANSVAPNSPTQTAAVQATPSRPTATSPRVSTTPTHGANATPTTGQPRPTATHAPLSVKITCAQAVDYSSGKVCAHTAPGASLSITVTYCSGKVATSASLQGTRTANASGNYTWTWTPDTSCRGTATATVDASMDGETATDSMDFTVR
jgi:hypothetical protein